MKKNSVLKGGGASSGGLRLGSGVGLVRIGDFFYLLFLLVLTLTQRRVFWFTLRKTEKLKKGLETHCLRGLYAKNQKKSKLNQRQNGPIWANLSPARAWIWGVIGNKCRKTRVLTMASLVTNARKGVF